MPLYVFFPVYTAWVRRVTSLLPVLSAFSPMLLFSLTEKIWHCTAGRSNHDFGSPGLTDYSMTSASADQGF